MKKILIAVSALFLILVITKPSERRCRERYMSYVKDLAITEGFEKLSKDNNSTNDMHLHDAVEKHTDPNLYIKVHDYVLFTTVEYKGLEFNSIIGIGVLNAIFNTRITN